jgi:hypothetical protein
VYQGVADVLDGKIKHVRMLELRIANMALAVVSVAGLVTLTLAFLMNLGILKPW